MPSAWQKKQFVDSLHRGHVVAYPTESVFGLGCDPLNSDAVFRLLALKGRSWTKGLILIASDFSQVEPYIKDLPSSILAKVSDSNHDQTTWVLPAESFVPKWLTGQHQTIAVRLVQHSLAHELCALAKTAIVSTSANLSGQRPLKTAHQVRLKFNQYGVRSIAGRVSGAEQPSKLIDPFSNTRLR